MTIPKVSGAVRSAPPALLLALALLALLPLWGCAGGEESADSSLVEQKEEDIVITPEMMVASDTVFDPEVKDGKALFTSYCAKCHGMTGFGNGPSAASLSTQTGMNLTILQDRSDEELYQTISAGKGVEMPPWGLVLTPEQRRAILTYVRTLSVAQ